MKKLVIVLAVAMLSVGAFARDFVDPAAINNNNPAVLTNEDGSTSTNQQPYWFQDISDKFGMGGSWCNYKAYPWTWGGHWEWDSIAVAQVKVFMDVGMWVAVKDCTNLKIRLSQIDIKTYTGSVTMHVSTNMPITFWATWAAKSPFQGDWKDPVFDPPSITTVPVVDQSVKMTIKFENVNLAKYGYQACVEVGTVTVTVKPLIAGPTFSQPNCW